MKIPFRLKKYPSTPVDYDNKTVEEGTRLFEERMNDLDNIHDHNMQAINNQKLMIDLIFICFCLFMVALLVYANFDNLT